MLVPEGMTESEVVASVNRVLDFISSRYAFGIYSPEDIRQHGWVEVIDTLNKGKYDPSRPFDNFVYVVLTSRFQNLWRNKITRNDPPCPICHGGEVTCTGTRSVCDKYLEWKQRNSAKANLQCPLDFSHVTEDATKTRLASEVVEDLATKELLRKIDERLPVAMRPDYLKIKANVSVPKQRRVEIEQKVKDILEWNEDGEDGQEEDS